MFTANSLLFPRSLSEVESLAASRLLVEGCHPALVAVTIDTQAQRAHHNTFLMWSGEAVTTKVCFVGDPADVLGAGLQELDDTMGVALVLPEELAPWPEDPVVRTETCSPGVVVEQVERIGGQAIAGSWAVASAEVFPVPGAHTDLLQRILREPTPAPPSTHRYWLTTWLLSVLAEGAGHSLREAACCHPAIDDEDLDEIDDDDLAEFLAIRHRDHVCFLDWSSLRAASAAGEAELVSSFGRVANWHDDGSFARTVLRRLPPLGMLLEANASHLSAEVRHFMARSAGDT